PGISEEERAKRNEELVEAALLVPRSSSLVPALFGSHRPRRRRSMRLRPPRPADTGELPPSPRPAATARAPGAAVTTTRRPAERPRQRAGRAPRRRHRLARLAPGAVPYPAPAGYRWRRRIARRRRKPAATLTKRPPPSPATRVRGSRSPRPPPRRFR